jgi:hypothetical protein
MTTLESNMSLPDLYTAGMSRTLEVHNPPPTRTGSPGAHPAWYAERLRGRRASHGRQIPPDFLRKYRFGLFSCGGGCRPCLHGRFMVISQLADIIDLIL